MSTAAMAAQTPFKPPFQQTPYAGGAQYTQPQLPSGTTTPGNVSPTSPRTSSGIHLHHARQLRPPQKPLYVPAVLRPTEKPAKHSPPKASETDGERPEAPFRSAVRRATSDSVESGIATIGSDESSEGCGPVTGPPSRNHWKPDSSTQVCTASCCQKPFSFFDRRHHCRRCGGIFCGAHSANLVRLNQHALFHPDGAQYRACDRCHTDYRGWEARRHSRSNSESSSVSGALTIDSPTAARRPDGGLRVGSVAGSAPATWAWSTF